MEFKDIEALDIKAPQGAFSTYDAEILIAEVEKLKPLETYLEVGVDKGKSLFMARQAANPMTCVYGVDIREDPKIEGTKFFRGDSRLVAATWNDNPINVLFIDGDHSYLGCRIDIESWIKYLLKPGVILFHDHDESSPGVMWAVAEFVDTHRKEIQEYKVFKRTDRNTSMALVRL